MEIFKKYDIRGLYPSEINEENAFRIGRAIATLLKKKNIFLNYDNRLGSIRIKDNFTSGLIHSGATVYELGMGPVTVSAFASIREDACGICISASHNPMEYTGILTYINGVTLTPEPIKAVYLEKKFSENFGKMIPFGYDDKYVDYITKGEKMKVKVGVDSMGGSTTFIAPYIFNKVGAKVSMLRSSPSSDFYGRVPEPSPENCKDLGRLVKKDGLNFGLQLDADGDRGMIVDDKGRALDPMITSLILIKYLKFKNIVATIACSSLLEDYAKVKYVKTGRPNVEDEMKTKKYDFGVETASHFYFGKYYPFSDGILLGLLVGRVIAITGKKLSELVKEFPKIYYGNLSLAFSSQDKIKRKMGEIEKNLKGYKNKIEMDGVKILLENGFMLFRPSNTEPLVRVYYEGRGPAEFKKIHALVNRIIK